MGCIIAEMRLEAIPCDRNEASPTQRVKVCMEMNKYIDIDYARELERHVFSTYSNYRVICTELIHTMHDKGKDLFLYHSPQELATLIVDTVLNPNRDDRYVQLYNKQLSYKSILAEGVKRIEKMQPSEGLLKCRRCNSTDITTEQRQTRSADEGMSVFAQCQKCFTKWKM